MKSSILLHIKKSKLKGEKLLSILLDPDKLTVQELPLIIQKINSNAVDFIFVGGSSVENGKTEIIVKEIRKSEILIGSEIKKISPNEYHKYTPRKL